MKRFYLVVFSCLVLAACSSKKQVVQSETSRSEKEHVVTYIDTLLYTPASQAEIGISISQICDSIKTNKTWKTKSGNATAKATVKDNILYVTADCDSITLRAKIKHELIKEIENNTKESDVKTHSGISGFKFYTTAILTFVAGLAIGFLIKTFLI